jgi:hypothetical protein
LVASGVHKQRTVRSRVQRTTDPVGRDDHDVSSRSRSACR